MINNNPKTSLTTFYNSAISSLGYCWQTPPAPEARGILAGAGAKPSRRKPHDRTPRPESAPDRDWSCCEFRSGVPAGTRTIFFDLSRWLRFAPPPANFRRPSGAENNFAEFASIISPRRVSFHTTQSGEGSRRSIRCGATEYATGNRCK
jgi:hypothetical protein